MGTVYMAVDESTGTQAAVKVLSPALAAVENFRERFGAEIESLKKLRHPNIVQLRGYGEQDGRLFYVMELVEGQSLQDELRRGRRFTWRDVTHISIAICAALKHAHDHGVVHRDLKPGNLLITRDEQIKLCDFGIAKLFGSTKITTGSVVGTADYMAPEQGEGKPVGPRTDLYSLGSVMYALLAGRPPFVGKSVAEVVHKVRFETPLPVSRLADEVPIELEQLIERLLEKDPQKRVPTALAVSHRLKAMEHALSVHSHDSDSPTDRISELPPDAEEKMISEQATAQLINRDAHNHASEDLKLTTDEPAQDRAEATHFTRVTDSSEAPPTGPPWMFWLRLACALSLATVAFLLLRKWMEPPTADQLYERISRLDDQEDPLPLLDAEDDIDQFLQQFPQDPRREKILAFQEQIELDRLERRLEAKARMRQLSARDPLEQLYLRAIRQVQLQPDLAASQLQALADLYGHDAQATPDQAKYVALARRQLQRLRQRVDRERSAHVPLIEERLAAAARLESENPQQARQIYQGILQLYGQRTWAHEIVQQARERLEQSPLAP
jgi:serine/threonine-protein kinase